MLIAISYGPPCVDVSKLNKQRPGANGPTPWIRKKCTQIHRWFASDLAPDRTVGLMECTTMDHSDLERFQQETGVQTYSVDAFHFAPVSRPRLWWPKAPWDLVWPKGTGFKTEPHDIVTVIPGGRQNLPAAPTSKIALKEVVQEGWWPATLPHGLESRSFKFSCMVRHRPNNCPPQHPQGHENADIGTLKRWKENMYSQAPYQYAERNLVKSRRTGELRRLPAFEEEVLAGWPKDLTLPILHIAPNREDAERLRKSLLGNAWHGRVALFWFQVMILGRLVHEAASSPTQLAKSSVPDAVYLADQHALNALEITVPTTNP